MVPFHAAGLHEGAGDGATRYLGGDRVTRNGTIWVALPASNNTWNVNSPPEWTPSLWGAGSCN